MHDWIWLSHRMLEDDVELMLVPPQKNVLPKYSWSWLAYFGYTCWKLYRLSTKP